MIATAAAGQTLATSSQQVMDNLQRARTEQVNKESAARLAKQKADKAVADAQVQPGRSGGGADLRPAQVRRAAAGSHSTGRDERHAAQARLDAARNWSASAGGPDCRTAGGIVVTGGTRRRRARPPAAGQRRQWDGAWDPTLPHGAQRQRPR